MLSARPDNDMQRWQTQLLDPSTKLDVRAAALRDHLPRDSPWRKAVLRHDARLWKLFPVECATFHSETRGPSDVDCSDTDSDSCTASPVHRMNEPVSIPQLQSLAADVCTLLASYARSSSLAAASVCHTDVDAQETVVQTLAQLRTMLHQFDDTAAEHEEAAKCVLESARKQQATSRLDG